MARVNLVMNFDGITLNGSPNWTKKASHNIILCKFNSDSTRGDAPQWLGSYYECSSSHIFGKCRVSRQLQLIHAVQQSATPF